MNNGAHGEPIHFPFRKYRLSSYRLPKSEAKVVRQRDTGLWMLLQKDTSPWHQSGSNTDPRVDPPAIAMFGLACHVAELEENLKAFSATAGLVGSVNRHFGNLREAIDDPSPELIEPVVGRLCDQLQAVCEAQPDLSDKCIDLQREMQEFAARFSEESVPDDELPF